MKSLTPEIIRAITPMFIATIGAVIAVAVIVSPNGNNAAQFSAGLGLAGTAIAGAAGLARMALRKGEIVEAAGVQRSGGAGEKEEVLSIAFGYLEIPLCAPAPLHLCNPYAANASA